jgi:hypothetical protein
MKRLTKSEIRRFYTNPRKDPEFPSYKLNSLADILQDREGCGRLLHTNACNRINRAARLELAACILRGRRSRYWARKMAGTSIALKTAEYIDEHLEELLTFWTRKCTLTSFLSQATSVIYDQFVLIARREHVEFWIGELARRQDHELRNILDITRSIYDLS